MRSGDTIIIDATCTNLVSGTVTGHTVVTGSFDSAYTLKQTVRSESEGWTMTVVAKRLGPCTDDQKPGDVIVNGVKTLNLLEYARRYIEFKKSAPAQDVPPPPK